MMMKMLYNIKPTRYDSNILENTNRYDSRGIRNNQVSINLIDNSIIDHNTKLDDIINNEIDNHIPYIDLIKYNKNNNKVTCRIHIEYSTIQRLQEYYRRKYDIDVGVSKEVELILDEHLDKVERQLENETATSSSSYIVYNNTIPRIDVLERLSDIGDQLKNNHTKIFSKLELQRIVKQQKGIKDSRVVKKYLECLLGYSIKKNQANIAYEQYNMSGFRRDVLYLIKNRKEKNDTDESNND